MEPLEQKQTKDRIAEALRREILSGRIADGEEVTQEQMAAMLGVSRMPVREAFQTLAIDGFLERLPNRHMKVIGPTPTRLAEIFTALAALEAQLLLTAAAKGVNISPLKSANEIDFRRRLGAMLDNPYMERMLARLMGGYPDYVWRNVSARPDFAPVRAVAVTACLRQDRAATHSALDQYYRDLAAALARHIEILAAAALPRQDVVSALPSH